MAEGQGNSWRDPDTVAVRFAVSAPTISLPEGGGAIRGAGSKASGG